MTYEKRTKDNPWKLKTPPGTSDYEMWMETKDGTEIIVCKVGTAILHYDARAINDLHQMLKQHRDWMEMGSKDEKQETNEGTVEHWARSANNPIGGWYRLKKNFRGRFGMYMPPLGSLGPMRNRAQPPRTTACGQSEVVQFRRQ